jgi:hypothetical protein
MIHFEEIDARLDKLGKNRAWLSEASGRKPDSIRVALAPSAPAAKRSELLQKALSDAIEKEEERRREHPKLPDRLTIECEPTERRKWSQAAASKGETLDAWIVEELNQAASECLGLSAVTTPHPERPAAEKQG